ncbi:MAG: hypothetical protein JJE45_00365 [Prolixibacteraceae bacterium]|nr:hypothetical protein [Prolixibacteraceae bacterium]
MKHWYEKRGKGSHNDPQLNHFTNPRMFGFDDELQLAEKANHIPGQKIRRDRQLWLSIRKAKDCFYSRRNGHVGSVIFGYSVVIRLFGYDLLKDKK